MNLEREHKDSRNARARARYACMDPAKKSAMLAARRSRRQAHVDTRIVESPVGSDSRFHSEDVAFPMSSSSLVQKNDLPGDVSTSVSTMSDSSSSKMHIFDVVAPVDRRALLTQRERFRYASMDSAANDVLLRKKSARHNPSILPMLSSHRSASGASYSSEPIAVTEQPIFQQPRCSNSRFEKLKKLPKVPWHLPDQPRCQYCEAFRFHHETTTFCCGGGQVCLAKPVFYPILWYLFTDPVFEVAKEFRRRSRSYNNAFAFTSIGMSFDPNSWWAREGIYALKVFGQVSHYVGQVSHYVNPVDGDPDKISLLQLFFLDTVDQLDSELLQRNLNPEVLSILIQALSDNPYTKFFKSLKSWDNLDEAHVVIKTSSTLDQRNCNVPTVDEVAAVWREGEEGAAATECDIRVYTCGGRRHRLNYYYSCYDPMQYPTLFPNGESGWHPCIKKMLHSAFVSAKRSRETSVNEVVCSLNNVSTAEQILFAEEQAFQENKKSRTNVSCREYYCYKLQMRPNDPSHLLHAGRLGHQFIIDMYIKLETSRLDYYKSDKFQKGVRTESLQGVIDSLYVDGETDPSHIGQKVILPSSFIGGPRDMRRRYANAMALVQRFGKPDLFFMLTCNPTWKEIQDHLLPFQHPHDRPDLIACVFKAKLEEFKDDVVCKKLFGEVAAYVYAIEYQKRGLPHAHWIIILTPAHKIVCPSIYDQIISAELPDSSNSLLREYVVKHMMHGPCGISNMKNSCMREGICKYHYPKDFADVTSNGSNGYPIYRRRNNRISVMVRNQRLDNRHVIPYSPYFLLKFDCHANLEIVVNANLVKYLYKYVYKGHDRSAFNVVGHTFANRYDEIQSYQESRYICAPEASWRLYGFPMSEIYPAVIVLPVHLPNCQALQFGVNENLEHVVKNPYAGKTMFTEFFSMNASNADAKSLNLQYKEFPEYFVWESTKKKWKVRQKQMVIGRLCSVSPMEGERYFERLLLMHVRCPLSFDDLLTVRGIKYNTFREAAIHRGLLQSDQYIDLCMSEAASFEMPHCLRVLFAMLLVYGISADPQVLWDKYYMSMSEDFSRVKVITDAQVLFKTVDAIELVLTSMDKTILDFPIRFAFDYPLIRNKSSKDYEHECSILVSEEDLLSINKLNMEQYSVYKIILDRVYRGKPGLFFLDGPGGTGKTFSYRALLAKIRSSGGIALAVASSGVAALLLPGGRTTHSRFKLPLDSDDKPIGKLASKAAWQK